MNNYNDVDITIDSMRRDVNQLNQQMDIGSRRQSDQSFHASNNRQLLQMD